MIIVSDLGRMTEGISHENMTWVSIAAYLWQIARFVKLLHVILQNLPPISGWSKC